MPADRHGASPSAEPVQRRGRPSLEPTQDTPEQREGEGQVDAVVTGFLAGACPAAVGDALDRVTACIPDPDRRARERRWTR